MKYFGFAIFMISSAAYAAPTNPSYLTQLVANYFSSPKCNQLKEYEAGCENPDKSLKVGAWVAMLYKISCGGDISCEKEHYKFKYDNHTLAAIADILSDPKAKKVQNCKDSNGRDAETSLKICMARRLNGWPTLTPQMKAYLNLQDTADDQASPLGAVSH